MNELIDFLTSKEVILVYFIAGLSCIVCFIVYIVEKNNDRFRRRHNTKELNKLVEQIKEEVPEVNNETVIYEEPVLENVTEAYSLDEMIESSLDDTIEELEYTSIEPDQETAKLELKKLEEQLIIEEEKKQEEIISIEEPVLEEKNIKLTAHEEAQEAEAIISLDELLSRSKELYDANEITQYEDEGNEPISIQDLEARMKANNSIAEPVVIEEEKVEEVEVDEVKSVGDIRIEPKFKSSPIISPIFGIEGINNDSVNDLELENTANYEKLDQEIKKTNEFLMTLKELQNKLE